MAKKVIRNGVVEKISAWLNERASQIETGALSSTDIITALRAQGFNRNTVYSQLAKWRKRQAANGNAQHVDIPLSDVASMIVPPTSKAKQSQSRSQAKATVDSDLLGRLIVAVWREVTR